MRKITLLLVVQLLMFSLVFGQAIKISGRVFDVDGTPIPYVTVTIKGTKNSVAADQNGVFSINGKIGDVLVVTGVGLTPKEAKVTDRSEMSITVVRSNDKLSEVVVTTALGISRSSKALGYSTATVNSDVLNISKPINPVQGLIGEVSGAQVSIINNSVDPQIRVQLRGERHLIADNQPLYIVDGMEVRADYIATLNPEDIDNISVLKSASSAALYGSEASNGVVAITTKRGAKNNNTQINFSQTTTMEELAYPPSLQSQFGGYGGESGIFFPGTPYQLNAINPYTGFPNYIPFENQSYGPAFNGAPSFIGIPNQYGQVDSVPYAAQPKSVVKQFMVKGFTSQTDVSVQTGDAKNSNYLGIQYAKITGIVPDDEAQRTSVRLAGKKTYGVFYYDYSFSYSHKYTNQVGNDMTAGWPLYWTLLNTPANIPITTLKDWSNPNSFGNLNNYPNAYYINPYWQIANSRDIQKQDNLQGVLSLNLKPTKWMDLTYRISAQVTNNILFGYRNAALFTPFAIANFGPPIYGTPYSGSIQGAVVNETVLQKRLQQDILATFSHTFFNDYHAKLLLGSTIWDRFSNTQEQYVGNNVGGLIGGNPQSQTSGLTLPGVYNIAYSFGIANVGNNVQDTRLIGFFSDLSLDYKNYIFLHGNFRRDYSSLLATGNNAYNVYGVDAAIVFTDMIPSLKSSNVLSFGKIRAAYSHTGQITLNPYSTVNTFNVASGYPYGGLASLSLSGQYNNPANVPEATNEVEAGIELGFLRSRINVGATYYHDNNYNQLFPVTVTSATGYTSANVNAANTISKGWEFDAKGTVVKNKNFSFDLQTNLAIQTTTCIALYGTGANATTKTGIGNANEAIVGMEFPQLYVSDLVRDPANGKIIVDATTGLPSLSSTLVAAGRTTPKYIWGITPNFRYKEFSLQIIGDYRGGYVFFNNAEQNLDFTGATTHTTENGRQNFIFPNSEIADPNNPGKYIPNKSVYVQDGGLGFWVSSQFRSAGTTYVEDAAAWKVRTISLSYNFTKLISAQKIIKSASLTALCNNALMFRPKENNFTDPEFNYSNSNGLGYNTYYQLPSTRQYTLKLNLTF
ncbi:MAG TPA: SusC/RagA family TonB-linked outer membrane protein [Chitinophagaceae bacterium]|nr:SusC/RagA family TonB-linked outer membrane protein [Chitinophagaceae bacterium]